MLIELVQDVFHQYSSIPKLPLYPPLNRSLSRDSLTDLVMLLFESKKSVL
jgi:hypothetical protein